MRCASRCSVCTCAFDAPFIDNPSCIGAVPPADTHKTNKQKRNTCQCLSGQDASADMCVCVFGCCVWVCPYTLRMRSISDQVCPSLDQVCPSLARVLSQSLFEKALNVRPNLSLCLSLSRACAGSLSRALSACMCKHTCGGEALK